MSQSSSIRIKVKQSRQSRKNSCQNDIFKVCFASGSKQWSGVVSSHSRNPMLKEKDELMLNMIERCKKNKFSKKQSITFIGAPERNVLQEKKNMAMEEEIPKQKISTQILKKTSSHDNKDEQTGPNTHLQILQERVNTLIQMKFVKIQGGDVSNIKRWSLGQESVKDQLDEQLEGILVELQDIKISQNNIQEAIDVLERKIGMIQKFIAQGTAVSEIIKRLYFNQLLKKRKLSGHGQNCKNQMNKTAPISWFPSHHTFNQSNSSFYMESTTKAAYKAPSKENYQKKKKKVEKVNNIQPMTRSTYGRDFLNYGSLPTFKYTPQHNQIFPSFSRPKQSTNYSMQFTEKKSKNIDFKQLDCYKDKFKNLKISFIEQKQKKAKLDNLITTGSSKTARQMNNSGVLSYSLHSKIQSIGVKTESNCNYLGSPSIISSKIKDSELNKMKYSFKSLLRA